MKIDLFEQVSYLIVYPQCMYTHNITNTLSHPCKPVVIKLLKDLWKSLLSSRLRYRNFPTHLLAYHTFLSTDDLPQSISDLQSIEGELLG